MESGSPIATVLIPAAGRGTRLGGKRKQFRTLGDRPLLVQTLRRFEAADCIHHIVVAVPAGDVAAVEETLRREKIGKLHAVVAGGNSRQASVGSAMKAVPESTELVLVHDAVRPFVPLHCIDAVVHSALRHGAASLAVQATDTLRRGDGAQFGPTVDRSDLYRMQTPQAFRRSWFEEAHRVARNDEVRETDDVALVQRLGRSVAIVQGSTINIKVTTADDWRMAQALWAHDIDDEVRDA